MDAPKGEYLRRLQAGIPRQSSLSIALLDTELRILWINETLAGLCGMPAAQCIGRRLAEMLPGLDVEKVEPMLRNVLATGERVVDMERHGPLLQDGLVNRVWSCSGFRLEDDDGAIAGVALVASDVTRRSQDREHLEVLNEASWKIGSTLDISRTAEETLDVLIPRIGDCGHINLLSYVLDGGPPPNIEPGGDDVRMQIVANRWLTGEPAPATMVKGAVSFIDASSPYYRWLSAGRTTFEPRLSHTSDIFNEATRGDTHVMPRLEAVVNAGMNGAMVVPISARGVILGTVALFRLREPAITEKEVSLAQDVLARSAICLDNARVYSRERATALELQHSMLPQRIGAIPGIELAYQYEPANTASEIGGDWFDVVRQPDGRVALIVGDVTGHDIHAASLMGQLRTVTRTLATLDLSPVEVLTRLDAMVSDMGGEVGATCVYAAFEPASRRCVIARAGHPLPALVQATGSVEFLELPAGLPLGVGGAVFESVEVGLEPGSILVLYTDGLIETRDAAIDVGMDHLVQAITAGHAVPFGPAYASALIKRLVADPADDIAVLVARIAEDAVA